MYRFRLLPIWFLLTIATQAQSHFQPGRVVLNSGDTLTGQIDNEGWLVNPRKIRFMSAHDTKTVTYSVDDLSYFEVQGQDRYVRATVKKDMRPLEDNTLTEQTTDTTVTDTAWLRILVQGPRLSLYELTDRKLHFYIQDTSGSYTELVYKRYLSKDGSRVEGLYQYRYQLAGYLVGDNARLDEKMEEAAYTEGDLVPIVYALNGKAPARDTKKGMLVRPFAGVGINAGGISWYSANSNQKIGAPQPTTVFPSLHAGIDLVRARNHGDLALRLELGYWTGTFKGSGTDGYGNSASYEYKLSTFDFATSVLYFFYRGEGLRAYFGVGAAINVSGYPTQTYIITQAGTTTSVPASQLTTTSLWFRLQPVAGIQVANRLSLEVFWSPEVQVVGNVTGSGDVQMSGLRVGYYFKGTH